MVRLGRFSSSPAKDLLVDRTCEGRPVTTRLVALMPEVRDTAAAAGSGQKAQFPGDVLSDLLTKHARTGGV